MHCYALMVMVYMISPKLEHYTCMVNVLGLVGHVQEVENMLKMMPDKYNRVGTCRIYGNVEMGECVGTQFLNWSLKMPWIMCYYQTFVHLLVINIYLRILNYQERKEVNLLL
jgi:pentatricopeptide repeat protein